MREGEVVGQRIKRKAAHFADFVSIRVRFPGLNFTSVYHEHHCLAALGVHAHKASELDRHAKLFEHFAHGGLLEYFTTIDIARRKAPPATAWIDAAPAQEHTFVVA